MILYAYVSTGRKQTRTSADSRRCQPTPDVGWCRPPEFQPAFGGRSIPSGCVAPRLHTSSMCPRRALPDGRLVRQLMADLLADGTSETGTWAERGDRGSLQPHDLEATSQRRTSLDLIARQQAAQAERFHSGEVKAIESAAVNGTSHRRDLMRGDHKQVTWSLGHLVRQLTERAID